MAPLRVVPVKSPSWTSKIICSFFLCSLFLVYNNSLLLVVVIFRSCSTLYVLAWQTQRQTGSCPSRNPSSNQNASLQSKTFKESTEISSSSSTGTSGYQEKGKPSPFDSEKSTTLEYSPAYSSMEEDSNCFDIGEEFSSLRIDDIASFLHLANYKSKNLTMPADERKEINGSFPGSGKCE